MMIAMNEMMRLVRKSSIVLVSALLLAACNFSLVPDVTPPPNYTPPPETTPQPTALAVINFPASYPDQKNGELIFAEQCAPCHGALGKGDGQKTAGLPDSVPAIGASEISRQSSFSSWYTTITQGNADRSMPSFDSFSEQDRWDVIAYTFFLSAPEETLAQGKEIYQTICAQCHGDQGKGNGPEAANLAERPVDFTSLPVMAGIAGSELFQVTAQGAAPAMPPFSGNLSIAEIGATVDYLRALPFTSNLSETITAASSFISDAVRTASPTFLAGVISGVVLNESGRDLPADQTVFLEGFDQQSSEIISRSTNLQADGVFRFEGVDMPIGRHYLTWLELDELTYVSDVATVLTPTQAITLPIKIFASTADTSSLLIDRLHLFFEIIDAKTIRVIELYVISNLGDKTVTADQPGLMFTLPKDAANLELKDGELGDRFLMTEDGFADTAPIQPGANSHQVFFSFELPYKNRLELLQPLNLDSNAIVVLVPANDIQIKAENLIDAGIRDLQGAKFQMYNIPGSRSGDTLHLTVTGQSIIRSGVFSVGDRTTLFLGLGALGAVLVFAGIILFTRTRNSLKSYVPVSSITQAENAETLMEAILTLDDLHRSGQLPETAYRQRRAELKTRLKTIIETDKVE